MSEYDRYHGNKRGSARKALSALVDQYGEKKGREVFHGLTNKRRKQGKGRRGGLSRQIRS